MRGQGISAERRKMLFWCGVLAPLAEFMPGSGGKGAWLAPVAAVPLLLLGRKASAELSGERGLAVGVVELLGRRVGCLYLIIYMVWGQMLLTLRLRLCGERLLAAGSRDGSLTFFLVGLGAAAIWLSGRELSAFARASQMVLVVLGSLGGAVLLLALPEVVPERILPVRYQDMVGILSGGLETAGVLSWGLFAAFLPGRGEERKKGSLWTGSILLTAAWAVILGNLGSELTGRLDAPFFILAKRVGVQGAFQRIESVVTAVWMLADLALVGVILFGQREMIRAIWPGAKGKGMNIVSVVTGVLLALGVFPMWGVMHLRIGNKVAVVNLVLGIALPCLLWLAKKRKITRR